MKRNKELYYFDVNLPVDSEGVFCFKMLCLLQDIHAGLVQHALVELDLPKTTFSHLLIDASTQLLCRMEVDDVMLQKAYLGSLLASKGKVKRVCMIADNHNHVLHMKNVSHLFDVFTLINKDPNLEKLLELVDIFINVNNGEISSIDMFDFLYNVTDTDRAPYFFRVMHDNCNAIKEIANR